MPLVFPWSKRDWEVLSLQAEQLNKVTIRRVQILATRQDINTVKTHGIFSRNVNEVWSQTSDFKKGHL